MRKRQTGVTAQGLAEGKHYTKEKEAKVSVSFKNKFYPT